MNTYLVRWRTDTNPHYPGRVEAMDIAEARVLTSSPEKAIEYVKANKTGVFQVLDAKVDNSPLETCQHCGHTESAA